LALAVRPAAYSGASGEVAVGASLDRSPSLAVPPAVGAGVPAADPYVQDVDAALEALREAGAVALRPPTDMPWGERLAFVQDAEGNIVTVAAAAT